MICTVVELVRCAVSFAGVFCRDAKSLVVEIIEEKDTSAEQKEIKEIFDFGIEIAIVIGGGNIFRGVSGSSEGVDRVQADYMGMLATVVNGLALQSALENMKIPTRLQSALKIEAVAEPVSYTHLTLPTSDLV